MQRSELVKWILTAIGNYDNAEAEGGMRRFTANDWEEAVEIAFRQDVSPYLFFHLKRRGLEEAVPVSVKDRLRLHHLNTLASNSQCFHALGEALVGLREAEVPVLALKGAFMVEHVYGSLGIRPMQDIDLLAHRSDGGRLSAALESLSHIPSPRNDEELCRPNSNEIHFLHPQTGVFFDIHFSFDDEYSPFNFDLEGLWRRAQPITIAGVETQTLSLEDHFLHLCHHTVFRHMFDYIKRLVDIHNFLEVFRDRIDWSVVLQTARRWGALRNVTLALDVLERLLGTNLPAAVMDSLPDERFRHRAADWAMKQILSNGSGHLLEFQALSQLLTIRSWKRKIDFLRQGATFMPVQGGTGSISNRPKEHTTGTLLSRLYYLGKKYAPFIWSVMGGKGGAGFYLRTQRWLANSPPIPTSK